MLEKTFYCNAETPNITEAIQKELLKDPNWIVRRSLAANPNITEAIQKELLKDPNVEVRSNLAKNPNITEAVKEELIVFVENL